MFANTFSRILKAIARKVLPPGVRQALGRRHGGVRDAQDPASVSYGYEVIEGDAPPELVGGWLDPLIAARQQTTFAPLLREMYAGSPREDFVAVTNAVQMTGLVDPLIVEVGCGSGWNSEVLSCLLNRPVRYIGVDYSPAMTVLGKRSYPDTRFVVGDATALPFQDGACDILLSGTVLMHLLDYRQAIRESRRVTRKWCIFHTVPVMRHRQTMVLSKHAYGSPVLEIIFNETELLSRLREARLWVRHVFESLAYDLRHVLGEPTWTRTYLCELI